MKTGRIFPQLLKKWLQIAKNRHFICPTHQKIMVQNEGNSSVPPWKVLLSRLIEQKEPTMQEKTDCTLPSITENRF